MKIKEIIFEHDENDFELWKEFTLTKEEEIIIQNILMNHETDGYSIRGNKEQIKEEI